VTRLAFLVDQLFSPAPGGMGAYVRELIPGLARADPSLDITLFHAKFESQIPEAWLALHRREELSSGILRLYPGWTLARRPALPASLASHELVHSPVPAAIPPVGPAQRLVVTVHDVAFLVHPEAYPPQWRLAYRAGLARLVRSADAVIAVSRHTAEDLGRRTRLDEGRVHVVPLAGSLPPAAADPDATLARLKIRRPYILSVGTLEPRKNLVRLVRAYRRVVVRGLPHSLVLAGPAGWRHQALMREVALEAPGTVILTGKLPEADLDGLYRGADIFVYPSLYEGFGLPVLDALARAVPCVVSTSSSLPEVAGEAALFVDPRSVAAIAEAIERVATDPVLSARLREAGPPRAARFSWDETARRTLEVYKSIL
jgi:glycosyltransferase involved in cell wall biosynthesis